MPVLNCKVLVLVVDAGSRGPSELTGGSVEDSAEGCVVGPHLPIGNKGRPGDRGWPSLEGEGVLLLVVCSDDTGDSVLSPDWTCLSGPRTSLRRPYGLWDGTRKYISSHSFTVLLTHAALLRKTTAWENGLGCSKGEHSS